MSGDKHLCKGWEDYLSMNEPLYGEFSKDNSYIEKGRKSGTTEDYSKEGELEVEVGKRN